MTTELIIKTFKNKALASNDQFLAALQDLLDINNIEALTLLESLPYKLNEQIFSGNLEELAKKLNGLGFEVELTQVDDNQAAEISIERKSDIADSVTEIQFSFDDEIEVSIDSSPAKSAPPVYTIPEESESNQKIDQGLLGEIENLVSDLQNSKLKKSDTGLYASLQEELAAFENNKKLSEAFAEQKAEILTEEIKQEEAKKKSILKFFKSFVRTKEGRRRAKEISVITAVLLLITALALPFMNQDDVKRKKTSMKNFVDQLISLVEVKHIRKDQAIISSGNTSSFYINNQTSKNTSSNGIFEFKENLLNSILLIYTTPEPAALTDEEIINNIPKKPWLKKIDLSQLIIQHKDAHEFIASGLAKIVIQYEDTNRLFNGNAVITGKLEPGQTETTLKVLINSGFEEIPSEDFIFEFQDNNLKLYITENIKLQETKDMELLKGLSRELSTQTSTGIEP